MKGIRYVIFSAAVAVIAAQVGSVTAGRPDPGVPEHIGPGTPGTEQVGDIQFVKNIGGWSGSDIEFMEQEVVKLDGGATGNPVCVADAAQPDGCAKDAEGNTIFQTEIRDFAIAGALSGNARVIDITNPAQATVVSQILCSINQNDPQVWGDLVLVAHDGASGTCKRPDGSNQTGVATGIIDLKDPRNPQLLGRISYSRGSHTHTVHPTQPLVYLSNSDLENPTSDVPIWDFSNPSAPVLVRNFTHLVSSPHDITFNAAGTRAYVASVTSTYILNTEDPRNPSVISTIPNEGISISHQADPTPDGDYLLVSDELGGGAAGLSPGGPVHVYDIRNEVRPVKVGLIWDDCVGVSATCEGETPGVAVPVSTAHVFRINPDGYTMAIAWYKDGVHVIDYSDIRGANIAGSGAASNIMPRTIGRMKMPNANTWAAKMWQEKHPGFVFANDINRGLDIFYVPELGGEFLALGTVRSAHPLNFEAGVGVTRADFETNCEYTPVTNGVDGWITAIPAQHADGSTVLTATARTAVVGDWDIDLYYYNENCQLIAADEDAGTSESGEIPAGADYVMATAWTSTADAILKIRFSVN